MTEPLFGKLDIHNFYEKYYGYLNVAKGYTENNNITFIIRNCRLKPYSGLNTVLPKIPKLERVWVDEYRNSLQILKNKKLNIILNDLRINPNQITVTDMYEKMEVKYLAKTSKCVYISILSDELSHNSTYLLGFLGNDDYLRVRLYFENNWIVLSPLYLGLPVLESISKYISESISKTINLVELDPLLQIIIPFVTIKHFIYKWPPDSEAVNVIAREKAFLADELCIT